MLASSDTSTIWKAGYLFLLAAMQLTPAAAVAALAPFDLTGASRAAPTAMGALEIDSGVRALRAPTGLTVTLIP